MPILDIVILALIQGITEFLPISSSGHLVLFHWIKEGHEALNNCDSNKLMDVAVHVGTLFSILLYFRKDVFLMLSGIFQKNKAGKKIILNLTVASIPVIMAGFIMHKFSPSFICSIEIVAWTTIIFGILLWWADRFETKRQFENLTPLHALLIGIAQTFALIPGTSRSGSTMTAARALGYNRTDAARFSILLGIVAIAGAGTLGIKDVIESGNAALTTEVLIAAFLSFISGWFAITLMMKWLEKSSFMPFVIYRMVLGTILLAIVYI